MPSLEDKGVNPDLVYNGYYCRKAGQELEDIYVRDGMKSQTTFNVVNSNKKAVLQSKSTVNYPWIKIGSVYTNIAAEPGGAWMGLVAYLISQGEKNFRILSGRHGDLINYTDKHIFAPNFYEADSKSAIEIQSGSAKFNHEVSGSKATSVSVPSGVKVHVTNMKDYFNSSKSQTEGIKTEYSLAKSNNQILILAWCFSLYSFNIEQRQNMVPLYLQEEKNVGSPAQATGGVLFGKSYNKHMASVNFKSTYAPYTSKLYRESCFPVRNLVMNSWTWVDKWDAK